MDTALSRPPKPEAKICEKCGQSKGVYWAKSNRYLCGGTWHHQCRTCKKKPDPNRQLDYYYAKVERNKKNRPQEPKPELCSVCNHTKTVRWHSKLRSNTSGYWYQTCLFCKNRNNSRKYKYNVSQTEYDQMAQEQGYVCAICGKPQRDGRILEVDHDHNTGVTRRLLCRFCNMFVGKLESDTAYAEAVFAYLRNHNSLDITIR